LWTMGRGIEEFLIFYAKSYFREYIAKVIKILRKNQARNGIGHLFDETCFCVHTLTSNPFLGVKSCNTTGIKVAIHRVNCKVGAIYGKARFVTSESGFYCL